MRELRGGSVLLASMALACGTPGGSDESDGSSSGVTLTTSSTPAQTEDGPATTTETSVATSSVTSSTGEGTTEIEDESGNPITFDLGGLPDSPMFDMGCRKVDFLFVIDNSGSMSAQQAQLLASFPGFISAMQAALEDTVDSYHVGVLTSDNYSGNAPGCTTIGDLVSQTSGFGAAGQVCTPFAEGGRFATEMDDLLTKFPCMAQVGTSGSPIEQPVTALVSSFQPAKRAPGGCNEGFLRDDAILVVVIVTDDPPWNGDFDDAHPGTVTTGWYDTVVAAKNGDPEAMVVIGFVPWMNISCVPLNLESPNLIGFIQEFGDQGVLASVCEPDYGPIFADAVENIVTTCENFDPPG
ncbi:vWA domain-containing protein [Paraliomyxa miuraensis]|uniref:vWA domain-containing protein n=1 Tax=Paraliomyxa miuraensis TaxID=376150 RepID=UPI002255CB24|nr:vWA domain-containing protein [Paraliomyxa miuraensis]MCX4247233.1 VWA domain-containing protein [Paraliomyxa miuraensis]